MSTENSYLPDFLEQDVDTVAKKLLGCYLVRDLNEGQLRVKIVETEAYDQADPASHAFKGKTPRNEVMFGPAGRLYVYFTYGMHYCANVVTGSEGYGSGVLIRAVEPDITSLEVIKLRSNQLKGLPTNGPAKLCRALSIDFDLRGHDLREAPLRLVAGDAPDSASIVTTTRVGISRAIDLKRRYYLSDSKYVSRR